MLGQVRFEAQVRRLERLGLHKLFDVQDGGLGVWLKEFGITPSLLDANEERPYIILPSKGRAHDNDLWSFYQQLLPGLEFSSGAEGITTEDMVRQMRRNGRINPFVLQGVSFDLQGQVAEEATRDWGNLRFSLCQRNLVGLTTEEVIFSLSYDSDRYDAIMAVGSISEDGIVPCLVPRSGKWVLSFEQLTNLMESVDNGKGGRRRWVHPYGETIRPTAPTAKQILPT